MIRFRNEAWIYQRSFSVWGVVIRIRAKKSLLLGAVKNKLIKQPTSRAKAIRFPTQRLAGEEL